MIELTSEEAAEAMRKRNRYRELILSGKLVLPHNRAAQLLGPDCLYHLYSLQNPEPEPPKSSRRKKMSKK
jgi:hypothetical protein